MHDFYSLGIHDIFPVSAEHGLGCGRSARPRRRRDIPAGAEAAPEEQRRSRSPSSAARTSGKSTLLNALTGEERAIVSPIAGTTRDAVDETVERDGTKFIFIDTAGIRRKGKTKRWRRS